LDDNNYCRNPNPERKERAWCYTAENWAGEDCDVPICEDSLPSAYPSSSLHPTRSSDPTISSAPTLEPECEGSKPNICGCDSVGQADYRGTISTTVSGKECIKWDETRLYKPEYYPDSGLEDNYCRNPEQNERAYCFTADGDREDCDVPICEDSLPSAYPSSSLHPTSSPKPTTSLYPTQGPQCEGSNPNVCGCASVGQNDYRGTINMTVSGKECIRWDEKDDRYYNSEIFPRAGLDNNYCRQPDTGVGGAWCFTKGIDGYTEYGLEQCDVPYCFPPTSNCLLSDVNANVSMSEELQTACVYHQCVVGSDYELDDYQTVSRSEVKPDCACPFEVWDCEFGSKACEADPVRQNANECCLSKSSSSNWTVAAASCECSIKPDCEAGDPAKCNDFAEYCCDDNDQQCKCNYQTKACRIALENSEEDETLPEYWSDEKTYRKYCGGGSVNEYDGGAQEACCGEDNDDVLGAGMCDFWMPLCTDFPKNFGTCGEASSSCCGDTIDGRSYNCECDLFTYAVEVLGYEDQIDREESSCAAASNIAPDNEVEVQSLQSIYSETGGDYWYNNTGWTTEQDQCSWFGITCDEQGYMVEINLPSNNMTGEFPANSLSSFYNLQRLVLGNNSLHGIMAGTYDRNADDDVYSNSFGWVTDTSVFFNLRDLTHVDLSQNNISGEVDVLFAPALQYANFSYNNFTSINTFKKFKKSHQTLTVCDVSHNSINTSTSILMTNVPSNIEQLILSNNLIHGALPTSSLEELVNLRRLDMSLNSLSGELPDFSSVYPSLQVLYLSDQDSEGLVGNIPESLANLSFLSTLNLGGNKLSGSIPPVLGNMGQLRVLNLSSNKLSQPIPKELGKLGMYCIGYDHTFCRVSY